MGAVKAFAEDVSVKIGDDGELTARAMAEADRLLKKMAPNLKTGINEIWYMQSNWFREGILGEHPDPDNLEATHVVMGVVEGSLDCIYTEMQGENWSPNGEAVEFVKTKGTHTSMSVGDVIKNNEGTWLCKRVGWEKI